MGYKLETGQADDYDLDITNAYFAYSPKMARDGEPRIALHLEGKAEGGTFDEPTELVEDSAMLVGIGDKWLITDDGAKVVDEGGRDRGWHQNSAAGRLQASAMAAGVPLPDRGDAQEAKIWVGLKLHFKRKPVKFGGDIGEKEVLFVTEYLGESEKAGKTAAKKAPAKAAAAEESSGDGDVTLVKDAVGGAIFKRLEKLASESDDYETWASEAVALPKISNSDDLQEVILDEERGAALYEAIKG